MRLSASHSHRVCVSVSVCDIISVLVCGRERERESSQKNDTTFSFVDLVPPYPLPTSFYVFGAKFFFRRL